MEYVKFSWVDYALFAIMFGLSGVVGIYFGCFGKQDSKKDYLHGGKQMKVFPVAMSLVASTLSGISLLGVPAEVYMYGTQYWMMIIAIFTVGFIVNYIYLPVFYKLQLTSVNEYLEIRFGKSLRSIASAMTTFAWFIGLPIVIYAPSLAFNQVTGFDLYLIAPIMSLFCIFYTAIGGVKAVVWTDTLQFSVTLCTLGCVLIMGTISVGGIWPIWEKAQLGGRIEFFNMNLDPTERSTFWNVVVGNLCLWTTFMGMNQATIQRFLAVPTYSDSKKIIIIFVCFTILTKSISCFSGLIMYAKYYDCDPLSAGQMKKADQILPFYVLDVAAQIPGLSGLFVAGLFSTALSTLSTFLNALAGTIYEDFVAYYLEANVSEKKASNIMKLLTLIIGLISVGLIFVVERLGTILQLVISLNGITGGPVLGLFTLGMLFPRANKKGALCGVITSAAFMSVVVIKNQFLTWSGAIRSIPKPLFTHGCNFTSLLNETTTTLATTTLSADCLPEEPFWLFRISFYYYIFMGTTITLVIGWIVSWIARNENDLPVNTDLLSPCVHRFAATPQYQSVEKEMHYIGLTKNGTEIKEPALNKLLN